MGEYHAKLSPSGAARWLTCPGSIVLCEGIVDKGSKFADEGTAAHDVAAMALTAGNDAAAYVGRVLKAGESEIEVTVEMAEHVQTYLDAVRARVESYKLAGATTVLLEVEQDVPIGHLTREPDATGRSDAIILVEFEDGAALMECWDLKFGRGVEVSAENNEQGQMYALGALAKFDLVFSFKPTSAVSIVIHQPRLSKVPSEWVTNVADLTEFGKAVTRGAHAVAAAKFCQEGGGVEFAEKYLNPSEKACKFCKVKGTCPKLADHVITTVADDFVDLTQPLTEQLAPVVGEIKHRSDDNLANCMAAVDLVEDWCKAIRAETERRLLAGVEVPGFKLVQGRQGARKWADEKEAEALFKGMRLKVEEMYDLSLISPTTAEKLTKAPEGEKPVIGPRQWPKVEAIVTRSAPKPSVAPASDKRPALVITPVADQFEDLSQEKELA